MTVSVNQSENQSNLTEIFKVLGVATLYLMLAAISLVFIAPNGVVSIVWPSSGLALAAVLIGGRRYAYGVFLGAFLANGLVSLPWLLAAPIALGNMLEVLVGAWLLRRTGKFDLSLHAAKDYLSLILWGGFVACSVAALNGATLLFVSGFISSADYMQNLLHWWMGDVLGVVLFAPLILVFMHEKFVNLDTKRWFEIIILLGLSFLIGQMVFLGWFHDVLGQVAKGYLAFFMVVWIAARLGKRTMMLALLMLAVQAVVGAYMGVGFFHNDIAQTGLVNYWLFVTTLSVVGMVLVIYVDGLEKSEQRALAGELKFRSIIDASPVPKALNDEHGNITLLNQMFIKTFGYTLQDIPTLDDWWPKAYPDPVYRRWVADTWQSRLAEAQRTNTPFEPFEVDVCCKDGAIKTVIASAASIGEGLDHEHLVVLFDITERSSFNAQMQVAAMAFETNEAIMITDEFERIVRVNKAFEEITGYKEDNVIGQTPRLFQSGKHDRDFFEGMWRQLSSADFWEGEVWDRRRNGEIYPKWLTITAVRDVSHQVKNYVAIFSDIGQRKQTEEEIYNLANYDILTKLPNRRLFNDRFEMALAASERNASYGAILLLDLDKFKILNDTLGHSFGDLMLIEVANRLKFTVRDMDTVARLGGDEFVVLVEDVDADPAEASQKIIHLAEKIRSALARPYLLENHEQHSSPSIGVCLYRGRAETAENLLKYADMAMYQAKDAGRDAVRFFDPAMQAVVENRISLEADLRRALPDKQLQLFYQIQLDNELRPIGSEALIRWIHPTRGMVSPYLFIPIAEESKLILEIGRWVLEEACQQLQRWQEQELTRNLTVSVNVSAEQFRSDDFADGIEKLLRKYQLDPRLLKLELTESVILGDVKAAVASMHAVRGLGVKLSMDDFGTGYSSLSYLRQLPLDQLKIDQSFVRDITTDPNAAVLVQTIIDMALNFRMNVIAEGVETEAQLAFLKLNDCMAYQGYLFSKPVPVDQFEALLKVNQFSQGKF